MKDTRREQAPFALYSDKELVSIARLVSRQLVLRRSSECVEVHPRSPIGIGEIGLLDIHNACVLSISRLLVESGKAN